MFCSRCGARNDDDAKFCDKCGADLSTMPRPSAPAAASAAPAPMVPTVAPPMVYAPSEHHAWWYPIGVWVILAAFFAFIDLSVTHTVTWSVWPIGIMGIFMVGIPLLNLFEERMAGRAR
jgi:hypothetical protein